MAESKKCMYRKPVKNRSRIRGRIKWLMMILLAVAALVLGMNGFADYHAREGIPIRTLNIFYLTVQLFTLESGSIQGDAPWQLEVARFLAPTVAVWAALSALAAILGERLKKWRLGRMKDHAIVCGLGRKGVKLATDFMNCGLRVVAIDGDPDNPNIAACREMGVITLVGDVSSMAMLRSARTGNAHFIAAVCGDDSANVEIALAAHQLTEKFRSGDQAPLKCLVHVVDMELCDLFRRHHVFTDTGDAFQATIFNVYDNAARQLFYESPLDHERITPNDSRAPQLIIVGFGIMGEALALQTARMAHFANVKKPCISVIDLHASDREAAFFARYPEFQKACDIEFVAGDIEHKHTLEVIREWVDSPELISSVAVCLDDEWRCLKTALRIMSVFENRKVPIYIRLSEECMLGELLHAEGNARKSGASFTAFGRIEDVCRLDSLLDENRDALARAIHETYLTERRAEGKSEKENPSMRPWEQLDPSQKDFNRYQADHIPVKLRAIGCYAARKEESDQDESVEAFTKEEIEIMSRMEHAHYKAKRFIEGWRLGPRDHTARTNPHLIEWKDLPEEIKEYDRQFVRRIPQYLGLIGKKVYRNKEDFMSG